MNLDDLVAQLPEEEQRAFTRVSVAVDALQDVANRKSSTAAEQQRKNEDFDAALKTLNDAVLKLAEARNRSLG